MLDFKFVEFLESRSLDIFWVHAGSVADSKSVYWQVIALFGVDQNFVSYFTTIYKTIRSVGVRLGTFDK